ncbi:hypothetical protein [Promicromonospora sp. NPDC019610]|uniref:hypothetical protein n=1 Tax=Promicromonospora sp. NPDC019610 TaxID=3364405 RepID=UPI00379F358C
MSPLFAGALALATEPSPNPTEGQLRPGLESWQVSPGLVGFLVTFALALACVLLFLNMSKHLRRAGHNARQQGLPVPEPEVISFSRPGEGDAASQGDGAGAGKDSASDGDGAPGADGAGSTKGGGGSVG